MKWLIALCGGAFCFLAVSFLQVAYASGDKCFHCTINNYEITEEYYVTEEHTTLLQNFTDSNELARATSLSIAHSSLHFGTNTRKLQLGLGGGFYDGEESMVFGAGKFDGEYLYTGSVGHTNGHTSANFAFHWTVE